MPSEQPHPPSDDGDANGDDVPAGDPRDPRFDSPAMRRARRRWLPRWALAILVALVATTVITLARHGADPLVILEALGFAAVVSLPVVGALLWLDRRVR